MLGQQFRPTLTPNASFGKRNVAAPAFSVKSKNKDATAELLGSAIAAALQGRLLSCIAIDTEVRSTAMGLMSGEFGGMNIMGKGWVTPLNLSAERIEVDVGTLLIDYGALVLQQKVQLKNIPTGAIAITLSAADLGNFMTHPLMLAVAAKSIQDETFVFDKNTVKISSDSQGRGYIDLEGLWEKDQQRYKMRMVPIAPLTPKGPLRLHVSAKRLLKEMTVHEGDAGGSLPKSQASAVAHGMAKLFSTLTLNLQGVELRSPVLRVLLPGKDHAGLQPTDVPLLQISMKLKIRSVPPLNMQF